jgi:hypothetical protein
MKSFKAFYEDFNIPRHTRFATSGKDIDFRGAIPAGFKGSNGLSFPLSQDTLIFKVKKRKQNGSSKKSFRANRAKNAQGARRDFRNLS